MLQVGYLNEINSNIIKVINYGQNLTFETIKKFLNYYKFISTSLQLVIIFLP